MCGRYALFRWTPALAATPGFPAKQEPGWNIAPNSQVLMLRQVEGERHAALARWGLTPGWAFADPAMREHRAAAALEADIALHGCYYGVVCNAGVARDNAFPAMTGEEWDRVVHTNLDAFYNVLHPVVMPMVHRRKPGRIVTLASVSALMGNRGQANYSAAKAGVIGATKSLAIELAKRNITVNCVAPGLIDTEMVSEEVLEHALELIPMRRMGTVDEVAGVVAFLMGAEASYVTRQVISVNGGMVG